MSDFISIFPNAASEEYCDKVIARFEYWREGNSEWGNTGRKKIWTRQEHEGVSTILKENDTYFLGDIANDNFARYAAPPGHLEEEVLPKDLSLLTEFSKTIWDCYKSYAEKYGILSTLSPQGMAHSVRIQKYQPEQGYHIWHYEKNCYSVKLII